MRINVKTMATTSLVVCCYLFIAGVNARPYTEGLAISEDKNAKYEIYVPDGRGEMAQQLLTLPEIRTLLARQADNPGHSDLVSLEGGKRLMETVHVPLPSLPSSKVGVSDVISSVRSIMASEMAQHEQQQLQQQQEKIFVVQAQTPPADEIATAINTAEAQTDIVLIPESTEQSPEESTILVAEPITDKAVSYSAHQREDHHHVDHHDHHDAHQHGDHHDAHHHGDHHDAHHHHHEHEHPSAVFEALPKENIGLLATNQAQDQELNDLTLSSNKIAWQVWNNAVKERSIETNQVFSPLALTSALGISFLGARGATAEAIDVALGLDRLTSRNPHLHLQQVANDVDIGEHFLSTQSHTVYVDEKRGKVQDVFKARLDTLYGAATTSNVTEAKQIIAKSHPVVGRQEDINLQSPFGIVSTSTLNVAWPSLTYPTNQDEEYLQFLNLPSSAQVAAGRKLVAVPTIRTAGHFYAGYNAELDATTVAVPLHPVREGDASVWAASDALDQAGHLSLVLVMPGSSSKFQAGGSGLATLESRLAGQEDSWDHLLRQTKPRHLLVEMPKLFDSEQLNLTEAVRVAEGGRLATLFDKKKADFSAISGAKPLYLRDIIQLARLNISSVATLPGGDDVTGRSADAKKKTMVKSNNKAKQNTAKPNKVQVTVKAPCQEAIEKAVAAAMQSHIKQLQQQTNAKPIAVAVKKPLPKPAPKPAIKPVVSKPMAKPVAAASVKSPAPKTTAKPTVAVKKPVAEPPVKPVNVKQTNSQKKPAVAAKQTTVDPTTTRRPTTRPATRPSTTKPTTRTTTRPSTTTRPPKVQQSTTKKPVTTTKKPATTTKKPVVLATNKPVATTKRPLSIQSATTSRRPVVQQTTKKPVSTTNVKPASSTTKKPVSTTVKPAVTTKKPPQITQGVPAKTTAKPKTTPNTPCPLLHKQNAVNKSKNNQTPAKPTTTKANINKKTDNKKAGRMERDVVAAEDHQVQRLSFNRAFLYAVRHNPTGLLLMVGRYVHPEQ